MPTYSTISNGNSAGGDRGDMARARRRGGKDARPGGGQASMASSVVNLLNTIVGAGTLAMPSVLSHTGIMLGIFLIIWSGLCAAFGLYLQSKCARYLERGTSSFFALSQITYPNAAVIFDMAIAVKCFGVGVSYMIIIGDLMPGVVMGFIDNAEKSPYLVDRHFWITAFMLLVIPLSFLKRLDSLKYTSIVALISIGYLIVLVIYHFHVDPHAAPENVRVIQWAGAVETLSALPVVVFAYTCHQNMFSIMNEIKDNSQPSIIRVIGSSIGLAGIIYIVVSITGYLTFGNDVVANIVSMYPTGVASTIGKAAIVVLVLFSIPLQVHPCRASLDAVLKWRPNRNSRNAQTNARAGSPMLTASGAPRNDLGGPAAMSDGRFALLTAIILTLAYITALSVNSLDRMLAFVGSTGSTSISFILPGLFYYKISDPDSIHHQSLMKEDDDMDDNGTSDVEDAGTLAQSTHSLHSNASGSSASPATWRWRRKWRWDFDHIEHGLLRKLSLGIAFYGIVVMAVCLIMNIFMQAGH
ncbi:transmembrane amino acid transporter protein-domain-containing protein [Emericellopsis atlantica]|uniref:Transmembrane amino acid transporter protein-domain-containing protein n=1 Tax=Emericellopsis atlantica TaxID=2614577 RepID=A0A9P7ZUK0_9HYPO|nr:transmembrane amino acid transporter protein-domain-containing protein [Emericellopsis atlantica]KAG9258520.1 transmembrane amino acid transporter protein-domain-containing protein [Emericellopsis atlantica]